MAKYILDIEKLKSKTGLSQKEIAIKLGVSEAKITECKTIPSKSWEMIVNYQRNFEFFIPIKDLLLKIEE
jgi:hypothetical protein